MKMPNHEVTQVSVTSRSPLLIQVGQMKSHRQER